MNSTQALIVTAAIMVIAFQSVFAMFARITIQNELEKIRKLLEKHLSDG